MFWLPIVAELHASGGLYPRPLWHLFRSCLALLLERDLVDLMRSEVDSYERSSMGF